MHKTPGRQAQQESSPFTVVHKDEIDDFHEHLNRQKADGQFTEEIKENARLLCYP